MKRTEQIGNAKVTADYSRLPKVYFTANIGGQAIWDDEKKEWVKCHKEFGWRFKAQLKAKFRLE
ncbi:MAG: hypothetical protein GWN93_06805 [Deltaproteobacteria bacterium]|nr:hypothetical protein [Deltaproteobacteria bacterium]